MTAGNELEILIAPSGVVPVLTFLKDHINAQYTNISDLCGMDVPSREYRFEVSKGGGKRSSGVGMVFKDKRQAFLHEAFQKCNSADSEYILCCTFLEFNFVVMIQATLEIIFVHRKSASSYSGYSLILNTSKYCQCSNTRKPLVHGILVVKP